MKKCVLLFLLAAVLLGAAVCVPGCSPGKTPPAEETGPTGTEPASGTDSGKEGEETMRPEERKGNDPLALCITEAGSLTGDAAAVRARYADYRAMGFTAIRIDGGFSAPSADRYEMTSYFSAQLKEAKKAGLTVKLIAPTVMTIPGYLAGDPDVFFYDELGRAGINSVSYFWDGLLSYTENALRQELKAIRDGGLLDVIGGLVVDFGAAGEPIYPAQWTQGRSESETLWWFGDAAARDFREEMTEKYGSVSALNGAWGTSYASFAEVAPPKRGEGKGQCFSDALDWYLGAKREFIEGQIGVFRTVTAEFGLDVPLVLYMPGTRFTSSVREAAVASADPAGPVCLGADNEFMADMAAKYGCVLQFTGSTDTAGITAIRRYMLEKGYGEIPVYAENAGDAGSAAVFVTMNDYFFSVGMAGIDFTNASHIYGKSASEQTALHGGLEKMMEGMIPYVASLDLTVPPPFFDGKAAAPEGEVLVYTVTVSMGDEPFAFVFTELPAVNFTVRAGDVLEYDVYLADAVSGIGAVDGNFAGGGTIRDNPGISDGEGVQAHPNGDLSSFAAGKWYRRRLTVGTADNDGKILSVVMLAAHPEKRLGGRDGVFTVCYDNIRILRDGEVVCTVYGDGVSVPLSAIRTTMTKAASAKVSFGSADDYGET